MQRTKKEIEEARAHLLRYLKPGDTLYTVLRHVSSSGMSRRIDVYKLNGGEPDYLSGWVGAILGLRVHDKGGLVVGGCGMDMGFHVVSNLSRALFPDGYGCTGERCPSNDHSNGDRDYTPGDKHWHTGADYAFRARWL